MATSTLTFQKNGGVYVSSFISTGAAVIELERKENAPVSVLAGIDGMPDVPVRGVANPYTANTIFEIDVPVNIRVTVKSGSEVINAKILTEDD